MPKEAKSQLDFMKESEKVEEDALFLEETVQSQESDKEKYFDYYDDIKTSIKEDW